MRKRLFAVICVLLALAMLPGGASAKAKKVPKKDIGIQLYSVRSLIGVFGKSQGDYKPVLKQLADMGYTSVEAASYKDGMLYGQTPEQFRKDVEDAGMRVISTHCTLNLSDEELASGDFSKALAWWDECIAAHKAAGAEYIVVPSMRKISTLKDLQTYCRYFNEVGARCAAAGMKFGYHNHSREFEKIEDKVMLDYMLENTDPDKVLFEMDVYWTVMGKASPVDYFKKYPGRFRLLHIKDRREIGQSGMVGFDAIFANAREAGEDGEHHRRDRRFELQRHRAQRPRMRRLPARSAFRHGFFPGQITPSGSVAHIRPSARTAGYFVLSFLAAAVVFPLNYR